MLLSEVPLYTRAKFARPAQFGVAFKNNYLTEM